MNRMKTLRQRLDKYRKDRKKGSQKNLVGNSKKEGQTDQEQVELVLEDLSKLSTKTGSVMDYYRVEEELGRGAFARVFRGIQRNSGKEVAVKIVSLKHIAEKAVDEHNQRILRLKRAGKDTSKEEAKGKTEIELKAKKRVLAIMQSEIAVMRRISKISSRKTRNIVQLRDVLANEKQVCICMDLLTGGELFDRIVSRKRYSEKDAAFHVRRIMRALRVLHNNGIIHRDLKPENLVFESPAENSQIKLTDFGLARVQGIPDIHADSIVGSPGYIAPEVLERKEYGPACDVWSMGVILYILFVGGPPFHGKNDRETFKKIKAGKYSYPRSAKVSALAKDLVSKCLVVNPKDRITVGGFLNHPWLLQKAATADAFIGLEKLKTFNVQTKLKALTTGFVWGSKAGLRRDLYKLLEGTSREAGLTGEELTLIRSALLKFHSTSGKTITQKQFAYAMTDLGYAGLPLEDIYSLFDPSGHDKADIIEIIVGLSTAAKEWDGSSQMKFCFETYDRDGTGKVSAHDVTKMFKVFAAEMETGITTRFNSLFRGWGAQQEQVTMEELEEGLKVVSSSDTGAVGASTEVLSTGALDEDSDEDDYHEDVEHEVVEEETDDVKEKRESARRSSVADGLGKVFRKSQRSHGQQLDE